MKALQFVVLALALSGPMRATTIFFDEFGTTPLIDINGFHFEGVLFDFSPGHAFFNQTIGTNGNAEFSTDPVLGGPTTGILSLSFDSPVTLLQFDLLLRSVFPIDDSVFGPNGGPAYTVLLSNGTSISGSTAPQPDGAYSEGQFYYSGAAFSGAVVSFFNGTDAGGSPVGEFGLDNLTFSAAEPASALGLGTALLVLGIIGRRRRSR